MKTEQVIAKYEELDRKIETLGWYLKDAEESMLEANVTLEKAESMGNPNIIENCKKDAEEKQAAFDGFLAEIRKLQEEKRNLA